MVIKDISYDSLMTRIMVNEASDLEIYSLSREKSVVTFLTRQSILGSVSTAK